MNKKEKRGISYHGNVVPVEQDLVELGDASPLRGGLVLGDVLEEHVDKVIEAQQCAHYLLVILHDDVDAGADALVHQLCRNKQFKSVHR